MKLLNFRIVNRWQFKLIFFLKGDIFFLFGSFLNNDISARIASIVTFIPIEIVSELLQDVVLGLGVLIVPACKLVIIV